jgi:hypothetical protein
LALVLALADLLVPALALVRLVPAEHHLRVKLHVHSVHPPRVVVVVVSNIPRRRKAR